MLGDRLGAAYGLDNKPGTAEAAPWPFAGDDLVGRFGELSGASFGGGLYRVHDPGAARTWTQRVEEYFTEHKGRVICFGADRLGRQVALDRARVEDGHHQTLMLEPGTGEALEIPATLASFHLEELVDFGEEALAVSFYDRWRSATDDRLPLKASECVGYDIPLFLGGADEVPNLTRTDMGVYWSICGQLRNGTRNLPAGATISGVVIGEG
jgi:hypothetical protein